MKIGQSYETNGTWKADCVAKVGEYFLLVHHIAGFEVSGETRPKDLPPVPVYHDENGRPVVKDFPFADTEIDPFVTKSEWWQPRRVEKIFYVGEKSGKVPASISFFGKLLGVPTSAPVEEKGMLDSKKWSKISKFRVFVEELRPDAE